MSRARRHDTAARAVMAALLVVSCSSDGSGPAGSGGSATSGSATGGGAGASASTGGAGGAGGAGAATSGSGGVSPNACDKMCDLFEELGCPDIYQCKSSCDEWVERAGDCGPLMLAEIDCIADSTKECGQDVCQTEYAALDACAGGIDCFQQWSYGNQADGVFDCIGTQGCSNGQVRVECLAIDGGPVDCECFIGGALVGTCVNDIENCQVDFNCCAQFW